VQKLKQINLTLTPTTMRPLAKLVSAAVLAKESALENSKNERTTNTSKKLRPLRKKQHAAEPTNDAATATKKRKRRKVRSRQKNISKDNGDVKPLHLIPGQRNYQGRPLTEEMRSWLHLPTLVKSPFAGGATAWTASGNWDNGHDTTRPHQRTQYRGCHATCSGQ
jgi:hypothetical protein